MDSHYGTRERIGTHGQLSHCLPGKAWPTREILTKSLIFNLRRKTNFILLIIYSLRVWDSSLFLLVPDGPGTLSTSIPCPFSSPVPTPISFFFLVKFRLRASPNSLISKDSRNLQKSCVHNDVNLLELATSSRRSAIPLISRSTHPGISSIQSRNPRFSTSSTATTFFPFFFFFFSASSSVNSTSGELTSLFLFLWAVSPGPSSYQRHFSFLSEQVRHALFRVSPSPGHSQSTCAFTHVQHSVGRPHAGPGSPELAPRSFSFSFSFSFPFSFTFLASSCTFFSSNFHSHSRFSASRACFSLSSLSCSSFSFFLFDLNASIFLLFSSICRSNASCIS